MSSEKITCTDCGAVVGKDYDSRDRCDGCIAAYQVRADALEMVTAALVDLIGARHELEKLPDDMPGARQEDELGKVQSELDGIARILRNLNNGRAIAEGRDGR